MEPLFDTTLKLLCNSSKIGRVMPKFLFKRAIRQVVVEVSSGCNRQCEYCPQSIVRRPCQKMADNVLEKIISNLSDIDYSEWICLNLFNEPLLFKDHLFDVIKKIKECLPKSRISFSTNGDFLSQEIIKHLYNAGLDSLYITMHPRKADNWIAQQIENEINIFLKALDLPERPFDVAPNAVYYNGSYQSMRITIFSLNFLKVGVNRAEALSNIEAAQGACRIAPCYRPLHDICISYDGSIYPCCQFYHGMEKNSPFLIGNILNSSLFDVFVSPQMSSFRKFAIAKGVKPHPCRTCTE